MRKRPVCWAEILLESQALPAQKRQNHEASNALCDSFLIEAESTYKGSRNKRERFQFQDDPFAGLIELAPAHVMDGHTFFPDTKTSAWRA